MTMALTPAQRGRLGGLTFAATNDTAALSASGRRAFRESFADGHSCASCPPVVIPADLPAEERRRRADALYRLHFARLAASRRRG